jgi:hypothetical protein
MPWRPKVPSPTWRTFLRNHLPDIAAIDMFVVGTATFRLLYALIVLSLDRRRVVHFEVTPNPTQNWLSRQMFQPCDRGPPCTMYLETVDWATSKPSIRTSPWIRDAPHFGFCLLIRRMRSRSILGRPALFRDFQRQNVVKPARCHRRMVSG